MTLRQLACFATVARLGSVKAAARELGISEPAVSAAVGVLRDELADELYHREGHGLVLSAQGERLASLATEIGALAGRATTTLGEQEPAPRLLHIAVTGCVEEHIVGPLLAAFSERTPDVHANVEVEPAARFADLLDRRRADITLGPRPGLAAAPGLSRLPSSATAWSSSRRRGTAWRIGMTSRRPSSRASAGSSDPTARAAPPPSGSTSRGRGSSPPTCVRSRATPPRCPGSRRVRA